MYTILIACPNCWLAKAHRLCETAVYVHICDMSYILDLKQMDKEVKENRE